LNYLIAIVGTPLLLIVWVVVQQWAGGADRGDGNLGRCVGCSCGRDLDSCELH